MSVFKSVAIWSINAPVPPAHVPFMRCSIDLSKAANLWQYLDNLKSSSASYNLALCYLNGEGVPEDDVKAFQLCKKAADRGNKSAMKLLSKLYSAGIGCAKSEEAANHWKELAEEAAD